MISGYVTSFPVEVEVVRIRTCEVSMKRCLDIYRSWFDMKQLHDFGFDDVISDSSQLFGYGHVRRLG